MITSYYFTQELICYYYYRLKQWTDSLLSLGFNCNSGQIENKAATQTTLFFTKNCLELMMEL